MLEVVAALIWREDKFLICQRPESKARGLLWEFAGGKVEPGETKEQAIVRECREELGVELAVKDTFADFTHEYPDLTIHLTVLNAEILSGKPRLLEHNAMSWITAAELDDFEFCPADVKVAERIKNAWKWGI